MKKILLTVIAAGLLLLAGCGNEESPVTTTLETYQVTFSIRGHTVSQQTVSEGQYPAPVDPQLEGLRFACWQDETGEIVDPATVAVFQDLHYDGQAYPALTEHVPYLFANEQGGYEPDRLLSPNDLLAALEALAAPGARDYFPSLPVGNGIVTGSTLRSILEGFFPASEIDQVFGEDEEITRLSFSQGMNQLLGRSCETVTLTGQDNPALVSRDADFLEATVSHTSGGTDTWESLTPKYEPGFMHQDGYLYYVKEDGTLLAGEALDGLMFGSDGRYTSGDLELDKIVAEILTQLMEENPGVTGLDLLRKAYEYSRDSFEYERRWDPYAMGETGWECKEAMAMFTNGKGNCYNYAAVFWALARGLGYPAEAISGTCTGTDQPHGWVRIVLDGVPYFFDPEWEMDYRVDRHIYHMDMFMLEMSEIYYWSYKWKEV